MWNWLGRWMFRVLLVLAAAFVAAYAGDWTVYHIRGSPHSSVKVSRYMSVPLKGEKEEFDFLGTAAVPCARALFPRATRTPAGFCAAIRLNGNISDRPRKILACAPGAWLPACHKPP